MTGLSTKQMLPEVVGQLHISCKLIWDLDTMEPRRKEQADGATPGPLHLKATEGTVRF